MRRFFCRRIFRHETRQLLLSDALDQQDFQIAYLVGLTEFGGDIDRQLRGVAFADIKKNTCPNAHATTCRGAIDALSRIPECR